MASPEKTPPRVLILTETYHPVVGGGETQARLLAEGLASRGARVSIVTRRSDASFPKVEQYGDVTVHRLGPVGRGQSKKWGLLGTTAPALFKLRRGYDLIFVSGFRILGLPAVFAAKILRKCVVLKADSQGEMSGTFFGPGLARYGMSESSLPFRLFLKFRNAMLKRADTFVAITGDGAVELSQAGVAAGKVLRMPNGVDASRFSPAGREERVAHRKELSLAPNSRIAVYTGRLVSYKGLPLLLTVWRSVIAQYPDAVLLLVGEGGLDIHNCEAELRRRVQEEHLQDNVVFAGAVPDVSAYLRASDVFVYPTENDAFPSSLVEAMACGLPVVTTPVGAITEIVDSGVNGLIVETGDGDQFLEALCRVLCDSDLAQRLGSVARQTVLAKYAALRLADEYAELFARLVSQSAAGSPESAVLLRDAPSGRASGTPDESGDRRQRSHPR